MANLHEIEVYPNALSSEDFQSLIQLIDECKEQESHTFMKRHKTSHKESTDIYIDFANMLEEVQDPLFERVNPICLPALDKMTVAYKQSHPFLNDISPWQLHPWYNLQYYSEGQGYSALHCEHDSNYIDQGCDGSRDRILAWMIYLNNAECGTHFPEQRLTITPAEGLGVIWPSYWTHPHQGVTPNIGDKYIATGWFNFYDPTKKLQKVNSKTIFLNMEDKTIQNQN